MDESFCDVCPERSLFALSKRMGTLILKTFGRFCGLAGICSGFAIGDPALVDQLQARLGPWVLPH
ncbi:MAG: aminotransferase class I/II-fold pyridoxal phosphate-dependent enzyme [Roseobacter sp.]